MSDTSSRFLRVLRDLFLALLNATLILVALCLFLGLRLTAKVDAIAVHVAESVVRIEPLRDEMQLVAGEVAGLRADLAALRDDTGEMSSEAVDLLTARLDAFDARLDTVGERIEGVKTRLQAADLDPEAMLERAVATASAQAINSIGQLAGCEIPGSGAFERPEPAVETGSR